MLKKILSLSLLLAMLLSSAAVAEVTNRDMQLMGGVVVSNATDSFFFCPMEEGMTRRWGLYALSSANEGPIVPIEAGYPARLVHADNEKVYFLAYTDAERTVHALFSVVIASGAYETLLSDIAAAFVAESPDEMLYVTVDDSYTLRSYNMTSGKDTEVKDMSKSEKTIYDAGEYKGNMYFITKTANGSEDAYEYHAGSGKATNLDKPSPEAVTGLLYENYRIYTADALGTQIYAQRIGSKEGKRIGANYKVSLSSPRFGENIFVYDGEANQLVGLPLDGSTAKTIGVEGSTLPRLVLGGSKDELLLLANEGVYSIKPDLSSQTLLFNFNQALGGQVWCYVAPAGSNAIMVMGYGVDTITSAGNLLPTGVYAMDRTTGDILFSFPASDGTEGTTSGEGDEGGEATADPAASPTMPPVLGEVPVEQQEEGETYFTFSTDGD